jgi:hypothetical protein
MGWRREGTELLDAVIPVIDDERNTQIVRCDPPGNVELPSPAPRVPHCVRKAPSVVNF